MVLFFSLVSVVLSLSGLTASSGSPISEAGHGSGRADLTSNVQKSLCLRQGLDLLTLFAPVITD